MNDCFWEWTVFSRSPICGLCFLDLFDGCCCASQLIALALDGKPALRNPYKMNPAPAAPAPAESYPVMVEVEGSKLPVGYDVIDDWICCDYCNQWYVCATIDMSKEEQERIDRYYCKKCQDAHPRFLKTIYHHRPTPPPAPPQRKRKSSFSSRFGSRKKLKKRPDRRPASPLLDSVLKNVREKRRSPSPKLDVLLSKPTRVRLKLMRPVTVPTSPGEVVEEPVRSPLPQQNSCAFSAPTQEAMITATGLVKTAPAVQNFVPVPFTLEYLRQDCMKDYVAQIKAECAAQFLTVSEQDILDDLNDLQTQEAVWRELGGFAAEGDQ